MLFSSVAVPIGTFTGTKSASLTDVLSDIFGESPKDA